MRIGARDAWIIARLLCGRVPVADGEVEPLLESERARPIVERLRETDPDQRMATWKGFLTGRSDRDDWAGPVGETDPAAPPPPEGTVEAIPPRATLADYKRQAADTTWPWKGWLAGGVLNSLAADPGIGKTIVAMNLARVLWKGTPWPDGSENPFPAGTKTLWIPADHHYQQLADLAEAYGMPGESLLFNAPADDPTSGRDLDDPAALDELEAAIRAEFPGLVIVDTVGMTTQRNLGRPEDARAYFGPLMTIAGDAKVPFLLLTHLSKEAQALGRRIIGACRVLWKLTRPDPEGQPDRRKLWVDKSYALAPEPLGLTIAKDGCTFDNKPPRPSGEEKGPKTSARLEEVKRWLAEQLAGGPVALAQLLDRAEAAGYGRSLIYKARDQIGVVESKSGGRMTWSLNGEEDGDPLFPSSRFPAP